MISKNIKKIITIILVVILASDILGAALFIGLLILADDNTETPSENYYNISEYEDPTIEVKIPATQYTIEQYNIDLHLDQSGSIRVSESYIILFDAYCHKINLKVPIKYSLYRDSDTQVPIKATVSNISSSHDFRKTKSSGYQNIILHANQAFNSGDKVKFKTEYTYNTNDYAPKNMDEFLFNIIGGHLDKSIEKASFSLTTPGNLNEDKITFARNTTFAQGSENVLNDLNINYSIQGNKLSGNITKPLKKGENISIRIEYPDNYFTEKPKDNTFPIENILKIICVISVIIGIIIFFRWGKDRKYAAPVSFYPPRGYNSAEIGTLYNGEAGNREITSLLIYLANKGYWDIKKTMVSFSNGSREMKIIVFKKEAYTGNNSIEYTFFNNLRRISKFDNATGIRYVTEDMLFIDGIDISKNVLALLNSEFPEKDLYDYRVKIPTTILRIIIVATHIIGFIVPVYYDSISSRTVSMGVPIMETCCVIIGYITFFKLFKLSSNGNLGVHLCNFVAISVLGMFCLVGSFFPSFYSLSRLSAIDLTAISFVAVIILLILHCHMPKRNESYIQLLGEIEGFKNFLETTEKERIEEFVVDNPNYFYDILPYTYVLGISKTWIEDFGDLTFSISGNGITFEEGKIDFSNLQPFVQQPKQPEEESYI